MSLSTLRDSIRATRNIIYMNTGFTGPSPEPVLQRVREVMEKEATVGPASIEGLQQSRAIGEEAREVVASLLNATPDEIAVTHGTTEGLHVAIYGLHWHPGDEFMTCNLEHPALATPANVLEERGVTVRRVEVPANASSGEALELLSSAMTREDEAGGAEPRAVLLRAEAAGEAAGRSGAPGRRLDSAGRGADRRSAGHRREGAGRRLLLDLRAEVGAGPERDRRGVHEERPSADDGAAVHDARGRGRAVDAG